MKYIVSAKALNPVFFELVEFEAEDEDELQDLIFEELVECLRDSTLRLDIEEIDE